MILEFGRQPPAKRGFLGCNFQNDIELVNVETKTW